jgi:hypothetical protein
MADYEAVFFESYNPIGGMPDYEAVFFLKL